VKTIVACIAVLALLAMAPGAYASGVLDFEILASGVSGSSIDYAGGSNPLTGANLNVVAVIGGNGTPSNDGATLALTPLSGTLNFTTGNFTSFSGNTWDFGGGGTLTINGSIPAQTPTGGYSSFGGTSGRLLTASFSSASVMNIVDSSFRALGFFSDDTDSGLASYFGLPANNYSGFFSLSFTGTTSPVLPGGSFETSDDFVGSGDTSASPVPAPGFLVLLCSGSTVSLAGYALRRRKKAAAAAGAV
jgi:hypothetical protein